MVAGSISMTARTADKLISQGNGDAALLFLHLLRTGGQYDTALACKTLNWDGTRLNEAFAALENLELVKGAAVEQTPVVSAKDAPDYTSSDIAKEMADPQSSFRSLLQLVEQRLGKTLSYKDTSYLMELFDHLALPSEVIYLLVNFVIEDTEQRLGQGRRPRMSEVKRQGYLWAAKGLDTLEKATAYVEKLHYFRSQEGEILAVIGIRDRQANTQERRYINNWLEMGFPLEVITLACERTTLKIGTWRWTYCDGILRSWHKKGLHTLEAIESEEHGSGSQKQASNSSAPQRPARSTGNGKMASQEETIAAQQDAIRRMQEFLNQQKGSSSSNTEP
jgi:DnaD/phage-associated family protein